MAQATVEAADHDKYFDAHPAPRGPAIHDVAVGLADEGVPVRAIARATRTPGDEIYEILRIALGDGRLLEIPRDDWPAGTRRERSQADRAVLALDTAAITLACAHLFHLTRLQSAVFVALIRRPSVTKDQLHNAIESTRAANQDPTDQKMVDVVICHIRKKLKAVFGNAVTVGTIWGIGYQITPEQRERVLQHIQHHLGEQT